MGGRAPGAYRASSLSHEHAQFSVLPPASVKHNCAPACQPAVQPNITSLAASPPSTPHALLLTYCCCRHRRARAMPCFAGNAPTPPALQAPLRVHPLEFAGKSVKEKLQDIRKQLKGLYLSFVWTGVLLCCMWAQQT